MAAARPGCDPHLLGRRRAGHPGGDARRSRPSAAPRAARARPRADLWRRPAGRRRLRGLRRARAACRSTTRSIPTTHHPGAARAALRRRPRLPRQPPARPRGAGRAVLPRARGATARTARSCSAAPAGTTSRCRRTSATSATSTRASTTPSTARRSRCSTSPATAWRRSASRPPPASSRRPAPAPA